MMRSKIRPTPEQIAEREKVRQQRRRNERNKKKRVDLYVHKAKQFKAEYEQLCKKYRCSITSQGAVMDSRCFIVNGYRSWYTEQQLSEYMDALIIRTNYVK